MVIRLAVAAGVCALIGLEREFSGQPAGMRTHAIVGIGSVLFTIAGAYGFSDLPSAGDPGRTAAQVASGIGFLGAGVILRHGLSVRGLTTAGTLWLAAALGVASGAGMVVEVLIAAVLVLAVLLSSNVTRVITERGRRKMLRVRYTVGTGGLGQIVQTLEEHARYVGRVRIVDETDTEPIVRTVWLETDIDPGDLDDVTTSLRTIPAVLDVQIDTKTEMSGN